MDIFNELHKINYAQLYINVRRTWYSEPWQLDNNNNNNNFICAINLPSYNQLLIYSMVFPKKETRAPYNNYMS